MTETTMLLARIPKSLHKAVRLKSIRVNKPMNKVVAEKLAEWVNEPDYSKTEPKKQKANAA